MVPLPINLIAGFVSGALGVGASIFVDRKLRKRKRGPDDSVRAERAAADGRKQQRRDDRPAAMGPSPADLPLLAGPLEGPASGSAEVLASTAAAAKPAVQMATNQGAGSLGGRRSAREVLAGQDSTGVRVPAGAGERQGRSSSQLGMGLVGAPASAPAGVLEAAEPEGTLEAAGQVPGAGAGAGAGGEAGMVGSLSLVLALEGPASGHCTEQAGNVPHPPLSLGELQEEAEGSPEGPLEAAQEALLAAAEAGDAARIRQLLALGADPRWEGPNGWTPLHAAAGSGSAEAVSVLLEAGAEVEAAMHASGWTPLLEAAKCGRVEAMEKLLGAGARMNACNPEGNAPIHVAAAWGMEGVVQHWLGRGAAVNATNWKGITPLMVAASKGHAPIVEALAYTYGVDLNAADAKLGSTALHKAAFAGHTASMEVLLAAGAAPALRDKAGRTPLHWAAEEGHLEAVETFLKLPLRVKDMHAHDDMGRTPVTLAATAGRVGVVGALLQAGAC